MHPQEQYLKSVTRRQFLQKCQLGLGGIALASLTGQATPARAAGGNARLATAKAKNVIYLHMAGSPSQLELFDFKPELKKRHDQPCPEEFFKNQRFAFIKGHPKLLGPVYSFKQYGESGAWISNLMPNVARIVDKLTIVRSMHTDQFNHAPAQLFCHTGNPRLGWPSMGSWVTYGLGSENEDLPGYVVLLSGGSNPSGGKALWGSGFLPGVYQGVQCRSTGDPILYVSNPRGMSRQVRRQTLDALGDLNRLQEQQVGDPETLTRIEQFELAYRMQVAVPEVMDISKETKATIDRYGAKPGAASFGNNCLLARRLVEQGVRFVQLFDYGWDTHGTAQYDDLKHQLPKKVKQVDQPLVALIEDLEERGLLDETLVIWGGEFGRTSMNEARNGSKFLGRDHHPHAYTMLMAGGGLKPGLVHGETDDFGYFITEGQVEVHDLQATILHQLGLNPFKLSHPFQGLNARLIGPTMDPVVKKELLA